LLGWKGGPEVAAHWWKEWARQTQAHKLTDPWRSTQKKENDPCSIRLKFLVFPFPVLHVSIESMFNFHIFSGK